MLRPLASAHNIKPRRASPIHQLRNQSRLVAVRHAVNDPCFLRFARQERAGQDVGFDIDHDDVLLVLAA